MKVQALLNRHLSLAVALYNQPQADLQHSEFDPGLIVRAATSSLAVADCSMSSRCPLRVEWDISCLSTSGLATCTSTLSSNKSCHSPQ